MDTAEPLPALTAIPTPTPSESDGESQSLDRAREFVGRAHSIRPSPSLFRLEAQLRRGDGSVRQVAHLIEGSPALAARVLRMANSAYYAPRAPVISLNRAVAILGDTVLRQLILTSLVIGRQSAGRKPREALAAARLMGDAVRSAVICRSLAELTGVIPDDDAFSAGLLHDLGHVYLLDEIGEAYAIYLLDMSLTEDFLARELVITGTTHQEVGAVFAKAWNLPAQVAEVLGEHHEPEPGSLAAVVHASDWLVREMNSVSAGDPAQIIAGADAALAGLGLTREAWATRVGDVREQYAELLTLFDAVAA
jgi:HD-like signal output (HDOD) protein